MLKLWGYIPTAQCPLCFQKKCTLHHILVNCKFALDQGRYTWRHDSVLLNIELALQKLISQLNQIKSLSSTEIARKTFHKSFIREGQKTLTKNRNSANSGLLTTANDWVLLVDYDHKKIVFPPNIYPTSERWSFGREWIGVWYSLNSPVAQRKGWKRHSWERKSATMT